MGTQTRNPSYRCSPARRTAASPSGIPQTSTEPVRLGCIICLFVGADGSTGEATIGKWFRATGRRNEIFLSTKFGAKDLTENAENIWRPNSQPSYIEKRLESSLALLSPNPEGTDAAKGPKNRIDIYFQHRVDPDTPIERRAIIT